MTAGTGRLIAFLQRTAAGLLALDRLEESLEITLAEALRPAALDDLEEQRRSVLHRLGEDLEQIALVIAIDEDPQLGELAQVLLDGTDAVGQAARNRPAAP